MIFLFLILLAIACLPERRTPPPELPGLAAFLQGDAQNVEAAIRNMSLEQKLGQLIIVARTGPPEPRLHQWVREGRVGGVALSGLELERFLALRDSLRQESPWPLFFTTSGGALFNNQFSNTAPLPVMDALQALPSDSLRQWLQHTFLQQAGSLGINLAPTPYLSPLEQRLSIPPENLESYARNINWLDERHILSIADGFAALRLLQPVWGSAEDSLFQGFQYLVKAGLAGCWIHPSIYDQPGLAPDAVSRLFRGRLQFDGLLLAHLRADNQLDEILASGVDIIVTHHNPDVVMNYLLAAYRSGELKEQDLQAKLRRILLARQWMAQPPAAPARQHLHSAAVARTLPASLFPNEESSTDGPGAAGTELARYFEDEHWLYWQRQFQEASIIVASNPDSLLPFRQLAGRQFHVFHLGGGNAEWFDTAFRKYAALNSWQGNTWEELRSRLARLDGAEDVVLVLHDYALDSLQAAGLLSFARRLPVTLVNFQRLENLALLDTALAVVHSFDGQGRWQEPAAQALFGGIPSVGKLPYTLNRHFLRGQGRELPQVRLRYGLPEQAGIAPEKLVGIDAVVQTAIDDFAFPGCQVVVVKDGTVVFDKALGHHTYSKEQPASPGDLYDVASVTKVAATTLAAMKLYEEGAISLNARLRSQMSLPRSSRLRNLTVKKLMTHQSGLQPHMPVIPYLLYRDMENTDCSRYFCGHPSDTFSVQVADAFYFDQRHRDKILRDMHRLRPRFRYRYSDVNFILLQQLVEEKAGLPLDSFAEAQFYRPLGLQHTGFRPLLKWDSSEIVPTQLDRRWRHQLVHGYVHDETSALLGGVAGNAGLFATAEDLAVVFQMLLNGGAYGGDRYLEAETIEYFTSARHGNHRGLGFDKPDDETIDNGKFPGQISRAAFGHTGFTGTCTWADPKRGLIYVFLSNRIHPDINNRKIFEKRIRERIHQVIYDALDTYVPELPALSGGGMREWENEGMRE